jgi:uroporphyrinogen-III synthase
MIEASGFSRASACCCPRRAGARPAAHELEQRGAIVETLPLYETLPDMQGLGRLRALLAADPPEIFLHGSASGFLRFWEALRFEERARLQQSVAHGCLNPAVARALISRGIERSSPSKTRAPPRSSRPCCVSRLAPRPRRSIFHRRSDSAV